MISPQPATSAPVGRLNPRRCSAQDSVSLPRKRQKLDHKSDGSGSISCEASATQTSQFSSLQQKNSQESVGDLSASKWFDDANSNIAHGLYGLSNYDDEPPFFISQNNHSGSFDSIDHGVPDSRPFGAFSQQDSEKDDLRDVIDDLTIENKRLKQLLKNRSCQQDGQDNDKLFEVRVHGLSTEQKRELEGLLRNFASNLNINSGPSPAPCAGPPATQEPNIDCRSNDAASNRLQTDSGYTSNSNSGQISATPSNPGRPTTAVSKENDDKTVKSYLHNISDSLLPRQPPVMSERARMSLVVRRLENLFTGKKAAAGEHSQPLQQQEVSRLAANAETQNVAKRHRQEGSREAHILPFDSEFNIERLDSLESSSSDNKSQLATKSEASGKSTPEGINSTSSGTRSPDQRPTRPADLDVHRVQVAEENIKYIRHLGLNSPKLNAEGDKEDGGGGEGGCWIYLNLLVSMAQLHTINVTPAFIRKSIRKLSAKFELSEDGNQVRWKGRNEGPDPVAGSVHDSDVIAGHSAEESVDLGINSSDKHSNRMVTSSALTSGTSSEDHSSNQMTSRSSMLVQPFSTSAELHTSMPTSRSQPTSSFDYKPILFAGKSLSHPNLAYLDQSTGAPSRLDNSSTTDSNDNLYGGTDAGPIVFYNNTLFCSDSSGDRAPTNLGRPNWKTSGYLLGVNATPELDEKRDPDLGCLAKGSITATPEQHFDTLPFELPPLSSSCNTKRELCGLPASGIGGVILQDNFLLNVKIARTRSQQQEGRSGSVRERPQRQFTYQVASCSKVDLPPSPLPPPSYIFLPFLSSSSSEVEDAWDLEDEGADTSIDELEPVPPLFLAHFSTQHSSPDDGEDEMDSSSSIDMLATAHAYNARKVAAQEGEFESNSKPTPLDEDVVTGSLAATDGHGSESDSGAESDVDEAGSYTDSDDDDL